jgi:hypothetical protein
MMHLVCVDPARAREAWLLAGDLIRRALERTKLGDFAVLERQVFDGHALLWLAWGDAGVGIKAAAVTQVTRVNGDKYCTIVACAGDERNRWLSLIEGLEAYARSCDCRAVRIIGRIGWRRVLPGYRTKALVLERAL